MTANPTGQAADNTLAALKEFAEEFARVHLQDYTLEISQKSRSVRSPKEINDAIWGTIKLQPVESIILDSPLVQRLRFIRQLGVVHWVYPGAVHTRFEHTLGVIYQCQQLITAINEAGSKQPPVIGQDETTVLRLCALLHDVGHGVFSHVSEHALDRSDDLRRALTSFTTARGLNKVQLSELMAFFVIGSPAFRKLLLTSFEAVSNPFAKLSPQEAAGRIVQSVQRAIIGQHIDEKVPLLHELISGPFDADKLDYFVRDARLAGIPSVLDISRLVQKISVQPVSTDRLPKPLGKRVSAGYGPHYLFGIKWSGAAVLDELHLARVLLYAKIYRHPKVLAIEAMLEALFDVAADLAGIDLIGLIKLSYAIPDDQFLWSEPSQLLKTTGTANIHPAAKYIGELQGRLRNRRLYVNAVSIRMAYPGDPWAEDETQKDGLSFLVDDLRTPSKLNDFKTKLMAELTRLYQSLPEAFPAQFDLGFLPYSALISAKKRLSGGTEIDRAFVFQGSKTVTYRDMNGMNRPAWADAYDFSAASAFIFSPQEIAPVVYVAVEAVLRREYDVLLPTAAIELSKQNEKTIHELKDLLEKAGYYDGLPFDVRTTPDRLLKGDVEPFLSSIASKLEAFDEPAVETQARRPAKLADRIGRWLAQFRDTESIDCAMDVLERLRIIGRSETREALLAFIDAHPEFKGATVVILGGAKDSSSIQTYLSADLEHIFPRRMSLKEAAEKGVDAPLVFLDDVICSGGQINDILGNWFDIPDLKREDLNEQRELFADRERDYIRTRKVAFVFVAGWSDGQLAAQAACEKAGLCAHVFVHMKDADIPFAFESGFEDFSADQVSRFKEKCRGIGINLVGSSNGNDEKTAERALGYGNRAMLLISRYNVPTQVLTCIWKEGQAGRSDWQPLLIRRDKH